MNRIGRYDIVEEIGRGAMGVVFKASDPTIGRLVAIKVLALPPAGVEGAPEARDIFLREARAAGRLSHPGIVAIHDALEDPETKQEYIIMEFVQGQTLEKVLLNGPPLVPERACEIIGQAAEALEYAHSQQIVHRDLKPANILLTESGKVKITDFGIAKLAAHERTIQTVGIVGTPAYMSPEQVTGHHIDARSDLFSLGVVFYIMLTGEKPFVGDTAAAMFKIVYEDPVLPSQIKPELGTGYDYLILRCLAKDREKRYLSAREFLDDLDDVRHDRSPRSESRVPFSQLRAGDRTLLTPLKQLGVSGEPGRVWTRLPALAWAGLGAGAAVLLVLAGWGVSRLVRRPAPRAQVVAPSPAAPSPPSQVTVASPNVSASKPASQKASTSHPLKLPVTKLRSLPAEKKLSPPEEAQAVPIVPRPTSASQTTAPAAAPITASAARAIQLVCDYELKAGSLTVSNDSQTILRRSLKGKRKGKFLGIGSNYAGRLSQPLTIPAGSRTLSVRIVSADGALDLTQEVALSSAGNSRRLLVTLKDDRLGLEWAQQTSP